MVDVDAFVAEDAPLDCQEHHETEDEHDQSLRTRDDRVGDDCREDAYCCGHDPMQKTCLYIAQFFSPQLQTAYERR